MARSGDAVVVDTDDLALEAVISRIVSLAAALGAQRLQ
jgi:hypothetical protein